MFDIYRRNLIFGAGAAGLSLIASPLIAASPIKKYPFTLGVASGDPWPDGFVIWTRLAPFPLELNSGMPNAVYSVGWEISEDEHFNKIVQRSSTNATPEFGHSVHAEIKGLDAQRTYWYRFHLDGHVSSIGKAKTAPATMATVNQLRIGVAGCQNYEHGYYTAYQYMANENLDAIFHYGDYIYEGSASKKYPDLTKIRKHIGQEPTTVEEYRMRYAQYKLDPDLQAVHASTAFLMTFDDHEVDNNWAAEIDQDGTDPSLFLPRRYAAMRAWYENLPVRNAPLSISNGIQMFRRLDYGNLLRIHLLDTRQYRDDQVCNKPQDHRCRDPKTLMQGQILGNRQKQWLHNGLSNNFGWNLIAQQVVLMPYMTGSEPDFHSVDSWSGYPTSRKNMVQSILEKQIKNVVVATGDVHQNIVGYIPAQDDQPGENQVATEFVCTSISSLGDGKDIKLRGPDWRPIIARNPNVLMANGQRGYHVFTITPKTWRTDIMKVDKVSDHSGKLSRLASFIIEQGSPLAVQG